MERHDSLGEKARRMLSDLLDILTGRGLGKTAALQPVPVRTPTPVVIRRPR